MNTIYITLQIAKIIRILTIVITVVCVATIVRIILSDLPTKEKTLSVGIVEAVCMLIFMIIDCVLKQIQP